MGLLELGPPSEEHGSLSDLNLEAKFSSDSSIAATEQCHFLENLGLMYGVCNKPLKPRHFLDSVLASYHDSNCSH